MTHTIITASLSVDIWTRAVHRMLVPGWVVGVVAGVISQAWCVDAKRCSSDFSAVDCETECWQRRVLFSVVHNDSSWSENAWNGHYKCECLSPDYTYCESGPSYVGWWIVTCCCFCCMGFMALLTHSNNRDKVHPTEGQVAQPSPPSIEMETPPAYPVSAEYGNCAPPAYEPAAHTSTSF
eukprot:m.373011 g.373011  ORF g.373011 m.373011 type:complete len:180 (+) comp28154_c1_seq3:3223-3762(+)